MGKDQDRIDSGLLAKGIKYFTADGTTNTYQMKPGDNVMIVASDQSAGVCIVYLPSVAEAVGQFYFVLGPTAGSYDVSLYIKEGKSELIDITNNNQWTLLFCTGQQYETIASGT